MPNYRLEFDLIAKIAFDMASEESRGALDAALQRLQEDPFNPGELEVHRLKGDGDGHVALVNRRLGIVFRIDQSTRTVHVVDIFNRHLQELLTAAQR